MDSGIRGSKKRTSPFTLPTHEFHSVKLITECLCLCCSALPHAPPCTPDPQFLLLSAAGN